ncbi:SHOCT domain-containing protein [Streptomyces sp. YIM S03343]
MFWYHHNPGGWGWFAMPAGMILFWALLIAIGVLVFRALSRSGGTSPYGPPPQRPHHGPALAPEELLAERFARGEIDEDEYRRRLDVLRETAGPRPTKT